MMSPMASSTSFTTSAFAAADALVVNDVDDAIGALHDRARRTYRQTGRLGAVKTVARLIMLADIREHPRRGIDVGAADGLDFLPPQTLADAVFHLARHGARPAADAAVKVQYHAQPAHDAVAAALARRTSMRVS